MKLYAVRNQDGQYFRAKGYGGYGNSWVNELEKAKLYSKIGQARSRVTWWYNAYPEYGICEIVELEAVVVETYKEDQRIADEKKKKSRAEKNRLIKKARQDLQKAQAVLEGLE
jgi:hypothetical protein